MTTECICSVLISCMPILVHSTHMSLEYWTGVLLPGAKIDRRSLLKKEVKQIWLNVGLRHSFRLAKSIINSDLYIMLSLFFSGHLKPLPCPCRPQLRLSSRPPQRSLTTLSAVFQCDCLRWFFWPSRTDSSPPPYRTIKDLWQRCQRSSSVTVNVDCNSGTIWSKVLTAWLRLVEVLNACRKQRLGVGCVNLPQYTLPIKVGLSLAIVPPTYHVAGPRVEICPDVNLIIQRWTRMYPVQLCELLHGGKLQSFLLAPRWDHRASSTHVIMLLIQMMLYQRSAAQSTASPYENPKSTQTHVNSFIILYREPN
jgi:hypothetical protein